MMDKILLSMYGIFLIVGGFLGWKKGSQVSLIMGMTSGILVLLGVGLINRQPKIGYLCVLVIGAVLSAVFLMRLIHTHKVMPAVPLLVLSLAVFFLCLFRYLK